MIRFSCYYLRLRVLECSEPYAQTAGQILHVQIRVQPEDFFDLVDLLLRHCKLSPTTSLLGLEWMGLVESHKDILKGYRFRNILCVIMVEFLSILTS